MKTFSASLLAAALLAPSAGAQRLPDGVAPTHYAIAWTPDLAAATFRGEETIDVRVEKPTAVITLNAAEIAFADASVTQRGAAAQPARVASDEKRETATLSLARPLQPGEAQIRIRWTGKLNDQLRGLYLAKTARRRYAVTQFENTDARRAFPSFDEPSYKATFDVRAVIDRGDVAISNGPIVADTPGPGAGKHTVRFATTPKLSSYLVALAVGDFACESGSADGIPIRVCGTPERKGQGGFALEAAEYTMHFYNQYFGIRFPYAKLDLIGVPDFSAGAMENAGCIIARDALVFADPKTSSYQTRRRIAHGAVAHEMAHQWFGDLVTMKWWDDVWLNEGFATWMSFKPIEAWKPEWNFAGDQVLSALDAMDADSLESTRPIRQRAETPAEILELFDRISYNKAAAILRMVETWVGPEPFRKGVNLYLARHAGGNATSADFWNALAEASGKPVDRIMAAFVDQPGVPMVSEQARCVGGRTRLALSERRYLFDRARFERGGPERWPIPVCAGPGPTCALLDGRDAVLELPGCGAAPYPNGGARGYYRSGLSPALLAELTRGAARLSPLERVALIDDAWSALRVDRIKAGDFLALAEALADDRSRAVSELLADRLHELGDQVVADGDRAAWAAWVRRTFLPAQRRLGLSRQPGDGEELMAVRAKLLLLAGSEGGDPAAGAAAKELVESALADRPVERTLLPSALRVACGQPDAARLYDRLIDRAKRPKSPEEGYQLIRAVGYFEAPELIDRTLRFAISPEARTQDVPYLLGEILQARATRRPGWRFVQAHWPEVEAKLTNYVTPEVVDALSSFCDAGARAEVADFFARHPVPAAARTLRQTLETIDQCIDVRARQQAALSAWLTAHAAKR